MAALWRQAASAASVHRSFTSTCDSWLQIARSRAMLGLALVCFIGLFAFGSNFLGWTDPNGKVQLGLFMSFLFGIICGYRTKS
jgi:hypothetical protein